MNKDIIDYIFKESQNCIDLILDSIIKLKKYSKSKVILASSKLSQRNELKKILNLRQFDVLVAAHGEEALNYLNDNTDIKLIIADFNMPVISGEELLNDLRLKFSEFELGIILLGEKEYEAKMLKSGANEYIINPLDKESFNFRLDKALKNMDDMKFLNIYNVLDSVTNVKNQNALEAELDEYLLANKNEEFAFALLDVDNLSHINDEYGHDTGDSVLKLCANEAKNEIKGRDLIGMLDHRICIVLKDVSQERAIKIFSRIRVNIKNKGILVKLDELFFSASIGIVFSKSKDSLENLSKKAEFALSKAKENGKDRVEIC